MSESVLIIFKGDFLNNVAGVAVRYINIAKKFRSLGASVTIAGKSVPNENEDLKYIKVSNLISLIKEISAADYIVVHGGGPLIMALLGAYSIFRKKVVLLDAFAPHWLELFVNAENHIKTRLKISFNLWRILWAAYFFDKISVGTLRQKDLVRGLVTAVAGPSRMEDVHLITGGSEEYEVPIQSEGNMKLNQRKDFVDFAWLGGVWPWFDVNALLDSFFSASSESAVFKARLNFFGVSEEKRKEMEFYIQEMKYDSTLVVFNPWVPYEERFEIWKEVDCAVVWAANGLENDYASRTRNFDCITLGIPIIQNHDYFWSKIIRERDCGIVTGPDGLMQAFLEMHNPSKRKVKSKNILALQEEFSWSVIAARYLEVFRKNDSKRSLYHWLFGLPFSVLFLLNCLIFSRRWDS